MIFAAFAENMEQGEHALLLTESIRRFGGRFSKNSIRITIPENTDEFGDGFFSRAERSDVEVHTCRMELQTDRWYYAHKVFAAAAAEHAAVGHTEFLVWMDEDTILLKEPTLFELPAGIQLGYRPVMHNIIGSPYEDPLDELWSRVYRLLGVHSSSVFPMVTPADSAVIRPYFNAGLLVVRPEMNILQDWLRCFRILAADPWMGQEAHGNERLLIFLHQMALTGAIMNALDRSHMLEFPISVNYPLFFQHMFGADIEFDDLTDVITLRFDTFFRNPLPEWKSRLKGPSSVLDWIHSRFDTGENA